MRFHARAIVVEPRPGSITVIYEGELDRSVVRDMVPASVDLVVVEAVKLVRERELYKSLLEREIERAFWWRVAASVLLFGVVVALVFGCDAPDPTLTCDYQLHRCGEALQGCEGELRRMGRWLDQVIEGGL